MAVTDRDDKNIYSINTDYIYMFHHLSKTIFFVGAKNPMHLTDMSMDRVEKALGIN